MEIHIPETALVLLIGAPGSGVDAFVTRYFTETERIGLRRLRAMLGDDPWASADTALARELMTRIIDARLAGGRLVVLSEDVSARDHRRLWIEVARGHEVPIIGIVIDRAVEDCRARLLELGRIRELGGVEKQVKRVRHGLDSMADEGFSAIYRIDDEVPVVRFESPPRRYRHLTCGFDIIGDVHGCHQELRTLLDRLGYRREDGRWIHPEERMVALTGDLVDRGPDSPGVLRVAMALLASGRGLWVAGNHDVKLARKLGGKDVAVRHGLEATLEQLAGEPAEFSTSVRKTIEGLGSHYILDEGRLVVAHAGLEASLQGRDTVTAWQFALYGQSTGEVDEMGLPIRYPWAERYRGEVAVVYGHTPVREPAWVNNTICVDTGCVFGGSLTALRWPERALVSVPAARVYYRHGTVAESGEG